MTITSYTQRYFEETIDIVSKIDRAQIDQMVKILANAREEGGRLFILGVGGGAGHASHAVCDFRKIAGIEAYTPADNVSELTARVNDDGWDSVFVCWLETSRLSEDDVVMVFSVGGGNIEKNISPNLVKALQLAKQVGAKVLGVVGRDGGYTKQVADACALIPVISADTVTPHTEGWQALVWHLIVSHPDLKKNEMKWESTK